MRISKILLAIVLAFTSTASFAQAETSVPQVSAEEYLYMQIAELQDLREQLSAFNQQKDAQKVALYIAGTATITGLVTILLNFKIKASVPKVPARAKNWLRETFIRVGVRTIVLGREASSNHDTYLVFLNKDEAIALEQQVAQMEQELLLIATGVN